MSLRLSARLLPLLVGCAGAVFGQGFAMITDSVFVMEGNAGVTKAMFDVEFFAPSVPSGPQRDQPPYVIDFAVNPDTATPGEDYIPISGQLMFNDTGVQTITVDVLGDTKVEADETFFVDLSADPSEVIFESTQGVGTIENDDQTSLSIDDVAMPEGDAGSTNAVFTVSLSAASDFLVSVQFATADGTATESDGDYQAASGTLDFDPGETTAVIPVPVNGDLRQEANETFTVGLTQEFGATVTKRVGNGTIQNDDEAVLSIDDVAVIEGDGGTTSAVFTVTMSRVSDFLVTVNFDTADGVATPATVADNDYQASSGQVAFAPGETAQTLTVLVNGDTKVEADETYTVDLSGADGALVGDGSGLGTILNDDGTALSIGDVSVVEGDAGTVDAAFDVTLSQVSALAVTVDVATRDGSATAGDGDYQPAATRLTFPPGTTAQTFHVAVNGDTRVEPDESFKAILSNAVGARVARARGVAAIRNDDEAAGNAGVIRLLAPPATGEAAGAATLTAERTGGTGGPAAVDFTTADGTATAGADYGGTAGTLTWADGEGGAKSFMVAILDDNVSEGDETVAITLGNPQGAALGSPATGELVIVDDDQPTMLEPVGETEIDAPVNGLLTLQALATRPDGSPVAGAIVVWTVEGDATLVGEATTATGADGVATQQVELGARPGPVTVTAEIPATGQTVTFEIVAESDLDGLFDPLANPAESSVAQALDAACQAGGGEFDELCDYLFGLDPADQREVISELTPTEAGALADLLLQSPAVQLLNLRQHLAARRNGGGSGNQISLDFGSQGLPLGTFRLAISSYGQAERRLAARIDAAMFRQDEEPAAAAAVEIDSDSRLGFFANGRVEVGDRPGSAREEGFDLDTSGLTLGLDYQLRPRFIVGGALGLVDTESRLVDDGGGIDVRGESLSLFFTWFSDKSWVDGIVSYGRNDYDTVRNIDLPLPFAGQSRLVARGRPEGSQLALDLGVGYDATLGATLVGTFGRLSYIDGEVDPYTEQGAGAFDLTVAGQTIESLLLEAGLELVYASSQRWGVLQPLLRFSALHEFEDDSRMVVAGFAADPGGNRFAIATDPPDRDFLRVGAGLTATLPRGRAIYLLYEIDLERDDLDLYRLSGGLRIQF